MARGKKKANDEEVEAGIVPGLASDAEGDENENNFLDNILKKYGKGVVINGNDIIDQDIRIIPISPALDVLTCGIPEGSWVNLSSKSGVGKTTTALHIASTCQTEEYDSRDVYYLDIEGRLKEKNIKGIRGLKLEKFHHIRSTENKILSAQDFLTIGESILKNTKRSVMIIDSYSMLCHENELIGGIGTSTRGSSGYGLLAGFTRQMSQVVPVRKHIVIGIAQMMANVTGYGPSLVEKGGNSIMYQADIWLRAKGCEAWRHGGKENGKIMGQIVTWQTVKTAMHGAIVGAECESYIRYGIGIDEIIEILKFACDVGLIETAGAWYNFTFMEKHLDLLGVTEWNEKTMKLANFHGEAKAYAKLESDPAWFKALKEEVNKTIRGE